MLCSNKFTGPSAVDIVVFVHENSHFVSYTRKVSKTKFRKQGVRNF